MEPICTSSFPCEEWGVSLPKLRSSLSRAHHRVHFLPIRSKLAHHLPQQEKQQEENWTLAKSNSSRRFRWSIAIEPVVRRAFTFISGANGRETMAMRWSVTVTVTQNFVYVTRRDGLIGTWPKTTAGEISVRLLFWSVILQRLARGWFPFAKWIGFCNNVMLLGSIMSTCWHGALTCDDGKTFTNFIILRVKLYAFFSGDDVIFCENVEKWSDELLHEIWSSVASIYETSLSFLSSHTPNSITIKCNIQFINRSVVLRVTLIL